MPNTKSSKRMVRTSEVRRVANKSVKSVLTTERRKLFELLAAGNKAECEKQFSKYCSVLDKAVKKGVIKLNNASRRKSRIVKKIAAI